MKLDPHNHVTSDTFDENIGRNGYAVWHSGFTMLVLFFCLF
jgi:hypothetical protein